MVMNMVPDLYNEYGLSSAATASNTNEEEDNSIEVPVYQVASFSPAQALGGRRLQDIYGTAAMPYFDFAKRVQTGTVTFDPADPYHREAAESFGYSPDEPSTAQILGQIGGTIAQHAVTKASAAAGRAATAAGRGTLENFFSGEGNKEFIEQLGPGFKSLLPGGSTADAAGKAASSLAKGQTFIPAERLANNPAYANTKGLIKGTKMIDGVQYGAVSNVNIPTSEMLKNYKPSFLSPSAEAARAITPGGAPEGFRMDIPAGEGQISALPNIPGTRGTVQEGFLDAITPSSEPGGMLEQTMPTASSMGMSFAISAGIGLMMGQKPKDAVRNAAFSTVGGTLGGAIGGPLGAMVGSTIGSVIGGRVICNELCRQGLLSRRDVVLDYKFTAEHLTPIHVNGYHIWSLGVVRKLRKGKGIKLWHHIAKHRANEIAYIYNERDKPDYLGKIYRHVGEPLCYAMGIFCKRTDWSVLYEQKEV